MKSISKREVGIGIVVLVIFLAGRMFIFGNPFSSCEYTSAVVESSVEQDTLYETVTDFYLLTQPATCDEEIGKITNFIWDNDLGDGGMSNLKNIPKGTKFNFVKEVASTKHGIGTIDSGPGPNEYIVLSDEEGNLYYTVKQDFEDYFIVAK